jgi:hypothetical protein
MRLELVFCQVPHDAPDQPVELGRLPAEWVELERGIGLPMVTRAFLITTEIKDQLRELDDRMAKALIGRNTVQLDARLVDGEDEIKLVPVGTLHSFEPWDRTAVEVRELVVEARITRVSATDDHDVYQPRWRVVRAHTADELLEALSDIAKPTGGVSSAVSGHALQDILQNKGTIHIHASPLLSLDGARDYAESAGKEAALDAGKSIFGGGSLVDSLRGSLGGVRDTAVGAVADASVDVDLPFDKELGVDVGSLMEGDFGGALALRNDLGSVPAQVVQRGVGDVTFLEQVLTALHTDRQLPRLVLTGTHEGDDPRARRITFASGADFREHEGPLPDATGGPGAADKRMHVRTAEGQLTPTARYGRKRPRVSSVWLGDFKEQPWSEWTRRSLPWTGVAEADDVIAWRCVDRITTTKDGETFEWRATMDLLHDDEYVPTVAWDTRFEDATTFARVTHSDVNHPVLDVRLEGYEEESDVITAHLTTPYAGYDGCTGLHLVPEQDTRVAVHLPGRLDGLAILAGNVRTATIERPAPSLELERKVDAQLVDVRIEAVGQVDVESDLVARLHKRQETTIEGDVQTWANANFGLEVKKETRAKLIKTVDIDADADLSVQADGEIGVRATGEARIASNQETALVGGGLTATMKNGRLDVG